MNITKAYWSNDDGRMSLEMNISKVDVQNRLVTGFASADNLDEHGDVITAECAYDAFERFRGNIREMHQTVAVGKVVSFWQEPIYDQSTDKLYNGVCVTAYISTGAEDTWQKVLDGTLSGFSIGGNLVDSEEVFDKTLGHPVRFITKMDLFELSLVDNPANQLANVVSIQKVNGETVASGLAVDVEIENIYWCSDDQLSMLSKREDLPPCYSCGKPMEHIGWIESDSERVDKMKSAVNSYISKLADTSGSEGGVVNMTEENTEAVAETEEIVEKAIDEVAEETPEETVVESVEKSVEDGDVEEPVAEESETEEIVADVEEDAVEEIVTEESDETPSIDFEAFLAEIKSYVSTAVNDALESAVTAASESSKAVLEEATKAVDAVKTELDEFKNEVSTVAKRVDAVESETAVKKSGELGREPENIKKSYWAGTFLTADEL